MSLKYRYVTTLFQKVKGKGDIDLRIFKIQKNFKRSRKQFIELNLINKQFFIIPCRISQVHIHKRVINLRIGMNRFPYLCISRSFIFHSFFILFLPLDLSRIKLFWTYFTMHFSPHEWICYKMFSFRIKQLN